MQLIKSLLALGAFGTAISFGVAFLLFASLGWGIPAFLALVPAVVSAMVGYSLMFAAVPGRGYTHN